MSEWIVSHKNVRKTWVLTQVKSFLHWFALVAFGLLAIAPFPVVLTIVLGISVIAAIIKMPSLLVMAGLVSVVTVFFPPLAFILSIIFFLMKVSYLINHFKPLLLGAGLIGYLIYGALQDTAFQYFWYDFLYYGGFSLDLVHYGLVKFCFSALLIHIVLLFLYYNQYATKEALTIMATVPLFVIMMILPFLLSQIEELGSELDHDSYDAFEQNQVYNPDPDIHTVDGHYRTNSDGSVSYVRPHIRTNPDDFTSNNLSNRR